MKRNYFRNCNYKKHAKLCGIVCGSVLIIGMAASYVLLKNASDAPAEKETEKK